MTRPPRTPCSGTLGTRAKAPRPCSSRTRHPSGLCSICRAPLVERAKSVVVKAAEEWDVAECRTSAEYDIALERLQDAVEALRKLRRKP